MAEDTVATPLDDPAYRTGVVDLLGALAYGELTAFERLAEDAAMAPTLLDKAELATMASAELGHFARLREWLEDLGVDAYAAMEPFRATFDSFHRHTAPADWPEGLVKAYVGDGLAADFYAEVAGYLDPRMRAVVLESLSSAGRSDFVVDRVRAAIAADPRLAGRLALWGRRLIGEALTRAQQVVAERDGLAALLSGGADRPGLDLAGIGRLFSRLTENHSGRLEALGLNP